MRRPFRRGGRSRRWCFVSAPSACGPCWRWRTTGPPGIPPERQGKIFEPFVTSKNTNYNWGMGLYYVRKIVRSHLGRLRLESRDGEGARFQIMLPLYDPRQKE